MFPALLLLIGACGNPSAVPRDAFKQNDSTGLPRFKLVQVIAQHLAQLGPNDEIVACQNALYRATSPLYTGSIEYSRNVTNKLSISPNPLTLWRGEKSSPMPEDSYLDSHGKTRSFMQPTLIQIDDNGKKVGVGPINATTDSARYYSSQQATYLRNNVSGAINKIYSHEGNPGAYSAYGDVLYNFEFLPNAQFKIMRFEPNVAPKELTRGALGLLGTITHVRSDGYVNAFLEPHSIAISPSGKETNFELVSFDLNCLKVGNEDIQIGFKLVSSPDGTKGNNYLVAWNKDGKPVNFFDLCPELRKAMVHVEYMSVGKILVNDLGTVAIEISGSNLTHLPDGQADYSHETHVDRIYVLKVISGK